MKHIKQPTLAQFLPKDGEIIRLDSIRAIIRFTAAHYGIEDLNKITDRMWCAETNMTIPYGDDQRMARSLAMYISRIYTDKSYESISRVFNIERSSVLNHFRKIVLLLESPENGKSMAKTIKTIVELCYASKKRSLVMMTL